MTERIHDIVRRLEAYNAAYRKGSPLVSDSVYDELVEELRGLDPDNAFLQVVEPETFSGKREVRHPVPMLSTDKAYTKKSLELYVARVTKSAADIDLEPIIYRVTPKLDGLAGRDDGRILASRGNGEVGYDISNAFDKGVIPIGGRGRGIGEIVALQSYFDDYLSNEFEHPRNMVVGIITSDTLNEYADKALKDGAVHFVPYDQLSKWEGRAEELLENTDKIIDELIEEIDYPIDGVVAEVINSELKEYMGATAHHYRWQIAIKSKGETATTKVESVTWQVGRTGNVTPVMEVEPVSLSGATIRRVTAHHAGMIIKEKIGYGSEIEIIRSGEVIPKLERVLKASKDVNIPTTCPICQTRLYWQKDFLKCENRFCRAQIEQAISHWFKTLGNADWFGIKTIQKIVDNGFDSLEKIYALTEADFSNMEFGPVQSKNLAEALHVSRTKPVEDWRFLAALGIPNLGKGDSRKLLSHMTLDEVFETSKEKLEDKNIEGFGAIKVKAISQGIKNIRPLILHLVALDFNLVRTPLIDEINTNDSPISGKGIVFTGKMLQGTREDMQAQARKMGAKIQTAVSGKTDLLVCGEKVGAKKLDKARKLGIEILSEEEYLALIKTK